MFRLAIKNILGRKRLYAWIFAELIVASVLCLLVLDPVAVSVYDSNRPYGYVRDGHVIIDVRQLPSTSRAYRADRDSADVRLSDFDILLDRVGGLPSVARVIPIPYAMLESASNTGGRFQVDSLEVFCGNVGFYSGTGYFSEMGIMPAADVPGNPTLDQLDNLPPGSGIVVTRSAAEQQYGAVDRAMSESRRAHDEYDGDNPYDRPRVIVAVVENVLPRSNMRNTNLAFRPLQYGPSQRLLVRLAPGADVATLRDDLMQADLRVGNYRLSDPVTYDELTDKIKQGSDDRRLMELFAAFFLFNLFLGVLGTFWLMTSRRTSEAGISRAFGATPTDVRLLVLCESMIVMLAAWLTGVVIVLIYLKVGDVSLAQGMFSGVYSPDNDQSDGIFFRCWVDDFRTHFAVVAGLSLVVLAAIVSAGILAPSVRMGRISPVEALKSNE